MTPDKEIVQAEKIKEALTAQEPDGPVYFLRNARIEGKLNLRHHTVLVAVDVRDCEFLDEVDLRYCEFTQAVDLSGCTFRKEFNSGDKVESHTVYRKDLICSKAVFEGPVSFNGCRVEGSAYFADATFHYQETPVDFTATYFKKAFECNKATFKGPALFDSLECDGGGFFADATAVCSAVEP